MVELASETGLHTFVLASLLLNLLNLNDHYFKTSVHHESDQYISMGILCCKPGRPVTKAERYAQKMRIQLYIKHRYHPDPNDCPICHVTQFQAAQDLEAYRRLPARSPADSNFTPISEKPPELEEISEQVEPDPEGTLVEINVPSTATDTMTGLTAA
ncbi:hypothetical protein ACHAP5_002410 [Fusarium lateritium]